MRAIATSLTVLALLAPVAGPSAFAAEVLRGLVRVIGGNTLEIAGRELALYGIDAPELGQTCRWPGDSGPHLIECGAIARTAMMDLVAGAEVACEPRAESDAIAVCRADGFDIGANMVHTGWALAARSVTDTYVAIERDAGAARRGLWRGEFVPPWEWRQGRRLPAGDDAKP